MILEEMIIRIRASAEGVKQGVSVAKGSIQELQKEQEKLKAEIKLKFNSEEIKRLKAEMAELEKQKKELEHAIRFKVDSEGTKQLRAELQEVLKDMEMIEKDLEVHMSLEDTAAAEQELLRLTEEKKRLEGEIQLSIKTDSENAKKALQETEKQISDIERNIQIKIDESGANELSAKLKAVDENIKQVKASNADMEKSFNQAAVAAGAIFSAILIGAKKGLDTFNQYSSVMNGLSSQMEHLGVNIVDAMDVVQQKSADGLISPSDVAAAVKNLTSYGYTLKQAADMVDRLKDSAANNRQAHYSLGEAVRVTTEGIKNENSVLSDAVGVTKNISVMYREYADSIGKTVNELTQAEKVQASFNGFMSETEAYLGDSARYSKTLAGSQAELKASVSELAITYGEVLAPSVKDAMDSFKILTDATKEFILSNKNSVAAVTGVIAGVTGLTVAAGGLTKAYIALKAAASLNPTVTAIMAVAGALSVVTARLADAKEKAGGFTYELKNMRESADKFVSTMGSDITEANFKYLSEGKKGIDLLIGRLEDLEKVNKAVAKAGGDDFSYANKQIMDLRAEVERYGIALSKNGTAEEQLREMLAKLNVERNKAIVKENNYRVSLSETGKALSEQVTDMEELNKNVSEAIKNSELLTEAQNTLRKGQSLSADTLLKLIELYPQVAKYIAETSDFTLKNGKILADVAKENSRLQTATLQAEKEKTEIVINNTKKRIEAMQSELTALLALQSAQGEYGYDVGEITDTVNETKKNIASANSELEKQKENLDKIKSSLEIVKGLGSGSFLDSAKEKEKTTELEKQLQILEDQKATKEMSIEEEVARLEEIKRLYAKKDEEKLEMKKRLYAKEKDLADKHYADEIKDIEKLNKGRVDNTDFSALIVKYKALGEKLKVMYADYPETMEKMLEEVNDIIIGLVEKKADKIAGIERDNIEEIIGLYDDYISTMKKMDGLSYGFDDNGEPLLFKFDAAKEKAAAEKVLRAIEVTLDSFISIYGDKTEAVGTEEKALYEYLLQQKKIFVDKMKDLTIEEIADRQKLYEKENEDRLKAMEKLENEIIALQKEKIKEAISAEKERTKGLIDEVKKRYDAEIKAAEAAANAEIAVYEDKIKAIDALLKAEERQEAGEDYQDKINRLKETLKFETDDSNKYELQKEITNLTAENEKRKRKESLEDEKEGYREKIDLAKNNLSQQKEALQEKRDAEIAMHEEALESYTKKLEEELSALEKTNKKSINDLKKTLETQKREYAAFLKQKEDDTKANNTEIEKLMNKSTTNILDKLKERISEFAVVGASAGTAWRNAFNEMVADIMSSTDSYSASVTSAQAASAPQSSSTTTNTVQLYQSINTPTASPAKVARESKKALQDALKYV